MKCTTVSSNVDILLHKGLHIQVAANDMGSMKQMCSKCDNSCNINEEYGPHKIIDHIKWS